ncbi:MAG TPA: mechanosensitive ion channel family protein [Polyangiaceae bacterium]
MNADAIEKALEGLPLWPLVALWILASLFVSVLARNALRRWLRRVGPRMDPHLQEVLARGVPRPAGAAVLLLALSVGLRIFPLPPSFETIAHHVLPVILGVIGVLALMRIAMNAITAYGESFPQLKSSAGIGRAITWIVGLALIAVLISDAMGISLAPALTALGVGSLSVALALQDTLSNFFAGIYLLIDKPIRPGDFIRLDGGSEGYVESIGWRSTHLRTLAPSAIIVPNATLSKAVITNFSRNNPRLLLATPVEVTLEADPDAVGKALGEELAEAKGAVAGIDPNTSTFVRFGLGDRGLVFTLYCTVQSTADGGLVQQEIRKRALARLRRDGVKLAEPNPFAVRRP